MATAAPEHPVCVQVAAAPSVTLSDSQSKEIFDLFTLWLHPPGDIHLASETRRYIQRACINRTVTQNRPYDMTCLYVFVSFASQVETTHFNPFLSYDARKNEQVELDDVTDACKDERESADAEQGSANAQR